MILENTIKEILDGKIDSFSLIVEEYQQQIFAYIYKITKSKQDAEDLTQETFTKHLKGLLH